jgi:hypothetical protein
MEVDEYVEMGLDVTVLFFIIINMGVQVNLRVS